ncbi:MAG TPA: type VII secretion protein EccB [Streptosporangiaceae bacterium]
MRSRKDQVQAHSYVVGRLTAALVHGEPDAHESPLRRTGLGSFGGLMIGTLLVAVFLVWGTISPASKAAALTQGELIEVNGTGARFVYVDNTLRPVLNWSSALLLTGGKATLTSVSPASLTGIRQGQPLGIVGAPDVLPAATALNTGSWLACNYISGGSPVVSLSIGAQPNVTQLPAAGAAVVAVPGAEYLLWHGQRLRIDAPLILNALGLNRAPVIQATQVWLNAVPAGPDLRPLSVPGAGHPGPVLSGLHTRVGQVLLVKNVGSPSQLYVVTANAVAPVTSAQAAVLLTSPGAAAAYPTGAAAPIQVSPATITHAPTAGAGLADGSGAPPAPPADFAPAGGTVPCMDYAGAGGTAPRLVFATPPTGTPPALGTPGVTTSPQGAGLISVAPDGGALVRPQVAPGIGATSLFLVTDAGVKFPVPPADVAALGYHADQAAALPASLLGLLPTGPALDLTPLRG